MDSAQHRPLIILEGTCGAGKTTLRNALPSTLAGLRARHMSQPLVVLDGERPTAELVLEIELLAHTHAESTSRASKTSTIGTPD